MNPNTTEPVKRSTIFFAAAIVLVLIIGAVLASHAHAPTTVQELPVTAFSTSTLPLSPSSNANLLGTPGSSTASTASSTVVKQAVAKNISFSNKGWSLGFTIRPEWNVNQTINSDPAHGISQLHQVFISSPTTVILVSQNEAIAVSGDLASTTATQIIAGQSVVVRTYLHPNALFAYYKLFSIKESDATYYFFLKSVVADTSVTDAFTRSISLI